VPIVADREVRRPSLKSPATLLRAIIASACVTVTPAAADFTSAVALLSDYRYRGITYSDGDPSIQASFDWAGSGGLFAGGVASSVRLGRYDQVSGILFQGYAGYGKALTSALSASGGISAFVFPSGLRSNPDYQELFARLGSERWQAGWYLSPDYYGTGAASSYLSLALSHPLGSSVRAFASGGWFVTGRADDATPGDARTQRFDARAGFAWNFNIAILEASVVGVTRDNDRCRNDPDACKTTVVVALRKVF
jgi:uncharacterized protein (TIGR02001 family)